MRGDQIVLGHHLLDPARHVALEAQVAVGNDPDQGVVRHHDRDTPDPVLLHQHQRIPHGIILADGDRIVDHAVFGALHLAHLGCLFGNSHILVDHADTACPGDRDRHIGLGHRVHSRRNDRRIDLNVARKTRSNADFTGKNFRIARDEQHIVESQSFCLYSVC